MTNWSAQAPIITAWRKEIGFEAEDKVNRKRCGDFGCYIAFINSINAR